jgi:hypothetical protein
LSYFISEELAGAAGVFDGAAGVTILPSKKNANPKKRELYKSVS